MADINYTPGPVGVMSRSATLSYETSKKLTSSGIGQSTVVGVGGDPIPGTTFVDLLPMFEADQETKIIVINGEIGGREEERAAEFIHEKGTKPVIALIVGEAAPEGKRMGHAGAIVSPGGKGSAAHKKKILHEAGVHVVEKLTDIAPAAAYIMQSK